jgi:hypothetical protein
MTSGKKPQQSSDNFGEQYSQHRTTCSSFEQVDSIRFLKTNVSFYERAILVWIKFKILNEDRLKATPKSAQYLLLQEYTEFLRGYLHKDEIQWQ